jgi:uncharacterized protein
MTRIAAALLLALTIPLSAHADEASHRAKAQQLMTLLHTQLMVEHNADNLKTQLSGVAGNTIGPDPTPAKKAEAEDFLKQASQMIDAKLSWASMQSGITDIYVKNFTEEQLEAIITFYKTPAGSALITNMGTVNTQVEAFGSQRITVELRPELVKLVTAFREKEAPAAPKPAASAAPATHHTPAPAK